MRWSDRFGHSTFALVVACSVAPGSAFAGAWTLEQGEGQIIITPTYSDSKKGFDGDGNVVDISDYRKRDVYVFAEFGAAEDITLVATTALSRLSIENDGSSAGLGYSELGARVRAHASSQTVLSIQGLARIPGEKRGADIAQAGGDTMEYDVRGLIGHSFKIGEANAFLDLQAGYRFRNGAPPNEFRLDTTVGANVGKNTQGFAQLFNTFSEGGSGFSDYRYHNAQLSVVQNVSAGVSLQAGVLATVAGKNALRERGGFVGLWYRF